MEFAVKPVEIPQVIEFNFDELKSALTEKMKDYETVIYTDDQITAAKADRADLNRLKKSINDERIRLEREYMTPFRDFKARVDEVLAIIEKPVAAIDAQVKEYEARKKEEKRQGILDYLTKTYSLPYEMDITKIFDQKWLNTTMTGKAVKKEIEDRVTAIQSDLETLEELDEYQALAITCYKDTFDLRAALNEVKRQKDLKAAQERIEAERKAATAQKPEEPKPEEVKPEQRPLVPVVPDKPQEQGNGQWVTFSAYLTAETAQALKDFFTQYEIPFKRA